MNSKTKVSILLTIILISPGCITKGWYGMVPGKDVNMENVVITTATPWGTQSIKADKFTTKVSKNNQYETKQQPITERVIIYTNAPLNVPPGKPPIAGDSNGGEIISVPAGPYSGESATTPARELWTPAIPRSKEGN